MKKKMTLVVTALTLVVVMAIGGTLAYFTDTDQETNTFTVGDIEIEIEEIFHKTELMPGAENALTKVVQVENTGANNAYMWVELWIPKALCTTDGNPTFNSLHYNPWDTYEDENGAGHVASSKDAAANGWGDPVAVTTWEVYPETMEKDIGGVTYSGCRIWIENDSWHKHGERTAALLAQVYMDANVTQCEDAEHDDNCLVLMDGVTHYTGSWEIIVDAFGIQADGFDTIDEAMAAYYEANP